jgi:hypothetical protein
MDNNKNNILEVKFNILVDAISAIDIIDVDVKTPDENNILLYIKTKNFDNINTNKLTEICDKFSNEEFTVTYQIPTGKFVENKEVQNTDTVCIFIEK